MSHYSHAYPKARTEHRCDDCGRTIRPGERYARGAGMDGSRAWTWKECEHCRWLIHIISWDDGEGYGQEDFANWEPTTVGHLRLKALWLKKWTHADGSLYPVPTVTTLEDEHGFVRVVDIEATP